MIEFLLLDPEIALVDVDLLRFAEFRLHRGAEVLEVLAFQYLLVKSDEHLEQAVVGKEEVAGGFRLFDVEHGQALSLDDFLIDDRHVPRALLTVELDCVPLGHSLLITHSLAQLVVSVRVSGRPGDPVLVCRLDACVDLVDDLLHGHPPFEIAPDLSDGVSLGHGSGPAGLFLLGLLCCFGRHCMLCGRQHKERCHQGNTELLHLQFSSAFAPVPALDGLEQGRTCLCPWTVLGSLLALPAWFRQSPKARATSSAHRYVAGPDAALRLQISRRRRPAWPRFPVPSQPIPSGRLCFRRAQPSRKPVRR